MDVYTLLYIKPSFTLWSVFCIRGAPGGRRVWFTPVSPPRTLHAYRRCLKKKERMMLSPAEFVVIPPRDWLGGLPWSHSS